MQLVVLSAVMTDAMMLPMICRMVFHVSLLFFMVSDVFLRVELRSSLLALDKVQASLALLSLNRRLDNFFCFF